MNINQLNSNTLKTALALLEKKESFQNQIAAIDRQLEALLEGGSIMPVSKAYAKPSAAGAKVTTVTRLAKTAKPGRTKDAIVGLLTQAGKNGLTLQAIREQLKLSHSSLNSWMHSTGKQIKQIKKFGSGRYAWVE